MSPDPDHQHLYRLLAMLPGPEDPDFWKAIATANDTSLGYVFEKMSHIARFRESPTPQVGGYTISYLCTYLIMFFGGRKARVDAKVAHHLFAVNDEYIQLGEAFTRDLTDTAWRLLARYRRVNDDHLRSWIRA